ncbi:MAG: alpha/beta hydrolase [Erysipelotrichaceae bacterium]|jgi:acetyl esterase/lipase|nr:alpha/beta hydrolase [Erysipelotrichaceae bacterium]
MIDPKALRSKWITDQFDEEQAPIPSVAWIKHKELDVAYGDDPLQKLDIYYPENDDQHRPVLFLIHGGGYTHCDKRDWHLYDGFYALERGYVLISLNYRLAPKDPFPAARKDVAKALGFLRSHYLNKMDLSNLFLWGSSAGGHLVSLCGLADYKEIPDIQVKGVAALSSLMDLKALAKSIPEFLKPQLAQLYSLFLGFPYQEEDPKAIELLQSVNATALITPDAPAFYLMHGDKDLVVPITQSLDFMKQYQQVANPDHIILKVINDAGHAGDGDYFLREENVSPVLDFFESFRSHP